MIFSSSGGRCGLLSGGCLEEDLQEHSQRLLNSSKRSLITYYDNRGSDNAIWGLGLGCEGSMQILLLRIDSENGYQPLAGLFDADERQHHCAFDIDIETGTVSVSGATDTALSGTIFTIASKKITRLIIFGAGPDAEPVVALARLLGWRVTVVDHRAAYLDIRRFDPLTQLVLADGFALPAGVRLNEFDAAVVMSHHLNADSHYLAMMAETTIPYVGLLGPLSRRERLFTNLAAAEKLMTRLRAPVGLDLGGRTPEEIALSIVAEIQATTNNRIGMPFSGSR